MIAGLSAGIVMVTTLTSGLAGCWGAAEFIHSQTTTCATHLLPVDNFTALSLCSDQHHLSALSTAAVSHSDAHPPTLRTAPFLKEMVNLGAGYHRQLDLFQFLGDVSPLIQEACVGRHTLCGCDLTELLRTCVSSEFQSHWDRSWVVVQTGLHVGF